MIGVESYNLITPHEEFNGAISIQKRLKYVPSVTRVSPAKEQSLPPPCKSHLIKQT